MTEGLINWLNTIKLCKITIVKILWDMDVVCKITICKSVIDDRVLLVKYKFIL